MRRADKEITDMALISAFIKASRVCRLAMADQDQPYVLPLNFGYDHPYLYFHSADEGRKLEILERNPKVAFVIDRLEKINKHAVACEWGADFTSVAGEGLAEFLSNPEEKIKGLDCIMAQYSSRTFEYPKETLDKTRVIRVTITKMTCKGPADPS